MKMQVGLISATSVLALAGMAAAAETTAPSLASVLESSGITATGYVDGSYVYSTGAGTDHQFDIYHNSFQLNQAGLTLAYQPKEGFGAVVNIVGGADASLLPPFGSGDLVVPQAFVQYASGSVTVSAGRLATLAGAEVYAPTGNTNMSRSLLFFAEPLTHTGVRVSVAPTETFGFTLGVNNGWNYGSLGTSPAKTAEVGFSITPNKTFSLLAAGYFGKDPVFDAQRQLIDIVATLNATDALSFVVSYDAGKQESAFGAGRDGKWSGVAAYVNVAMNEQWRLSVRAEHFDDKDGFMMAGGVPQKIKEGTLTVGYAPVKSAEIRAELRYDKSDQPTFFKIDNTLPGGGTPDDKQTEFALEALYKF